jgi:hypothetical protein
MVSCLKRKNNFTQPCTKRIKRIKMQIAVTEGDIKVPSERKRKFDYTCTFEKKKLKIDDTNVIQEIILLIECGMCSREMLNQCKDRYLNYIQSKEMIEFLNLMKCKKTIEDEMNLYRLVYKIEKTLLNNKNLS